MDIVNTVLSKILPKWIKTIVKKTIRLPEIPVIILQPYRHKKALEKVRKKSKNEKIKIVFFVVHSSVWKYEGVYQLLEKDPRFEVIILICPVVNYGKENMLHEMDSAFNYFKKENYNVVKAYNEAENTYLEVKKEISPDIIFYTNPYKGLIDNRYYITKFKNTLTCYVQYAFQISNMRSVDQLNLLFHNVLWKFFLETKTHSQLSKKYSRNKGNNTIVTGYPITDYFNYGYRSGIDVWKNKNKDLKRIIWAPHHTIDEDGQLNLSNFFAYYQVMIDIAEKYVNKLQIAFKPHPLLKTKLYKHKDWGKLRTDNYYSSWENLSNGQLEVDEYINLFNSSDALIHDSGSFMAEYSYCGKPMLYTMIDDNIRDRFNEFGNKILDNHYHAYNEVEIIKFLENVIFGGLDIMKNKRDKFFCENLIVPNGVKASENIYINICNEIWAK